MALEGWLHRLLGGIILALTNNGFHALYLAVGIAGVTAFVLAFLLLTERKQPTPEHSKAPKTVTMKMFEGWREFAITAGLWL